MVSGGGSVSPASATTNSNGEAQTAATPGGALGTQTFRAASAGLTSVDFNSTISPGPAAKLALSTGGVTSITSVGTADLAITVQDAFSNTVTTATNTIALESSPTTSAAFTTVSGPTNGVATSKFTATTAGSYTITAKSTGLTSATASMSVTAGSAAILAYVSGDGQSAVKGNQLSAPLVVKVTDANGNAVAGTTVTFASTSGGGSVSPSSGTSGSNGQVSTTATLGSVTGQNKYTATAAGLTGSPITFTATATNAAPAFVVQIGTIPSSATVATTQTLTVEVRAADNSTVIPEVAVAFAKTAGDGGASATSGITDGNGRASVTLTLSNTAGTNTYTATVSGLTPITVNITGTAGAAAQLAKVSGGDSQTGNTGTQLANPLVVEVRDQFGNVKSGVAVTFAASSGAGTVSPSGAQNSGSDGRVSVNATLGLEVGTQTFTASSSGLSSVVFSATVNQAPATSLAQQGSISVTTAGASGTFTVIAKDANGNGVPGVTVTFAKTVGNGSVSPSSAVTGSNGQASTTVTLSQTAGANTFTATATGLTGSPVTVSVTGVAGNATRLVKIDGDDQTGGVGTQLAKALLVEARDQFDNPKSGVAVTFSVTSGNGSVSVTTAQNTGSDGRVQVNATLGSAVAIHQFTAASTGLTSVVFSATGTLIPASITKSAGDSQTVAPGISLLTPLKAHVTNAGGIVVPNATVTWAVASGGGSVSANTSLTDANGDATVTATVGSTAGTNTFTATVSGLSPVTFTATSKTFSNVTVNVQIDSGTTAVGSYQVTITFNKDLVKVDGSSSPDADGNPVSNTNVLGAGGTTGFANPPGVINIENANSRITINSFQPLTNPSGTFTVARITFTPIRTGAVTLGTAPTGFPTTVTKTNGDAITGATVTFSQSSFTID